MNEIFNETNRKILLENSNQKVEIKQLKIEVENLKADRKYWFDRAMYYKHKWKIASMFLTATCIGLTAGTFISLYIR